MSVSWILYFIGWGLSFLYDLIFSWDYLKKHYNIDRRHQGDRLIPYAAGIIVANFIISGLWPLYAVGDLYHAIRNDDVYKSTRL